MTVDDQLREIIVIVYFLFLSLIGGRSLSRPTSGEDEVTVSLTVPSRIWPWLGAFGEIKAFVGGFSMRLVFGGCRYSGRNGPVLTVDR